MENEKIIKRGEYALIRNIVLAGFLLWLVLFASGLVEFSGSKPIYALFSVVFLVMLVSGFYRQVSYSYLFLVIFLWLGFWLKLTVHTILGYHYIEPIGSFNGMAAAWNEVLWVAIVASIGVIVGRILYEFVRGRSTIVMRNDRFKAPVWYLAIRKWLWIIIMVVAGGVVIFNAVYSIHQIGLAPRTILMWPLNAVIAWMLNIGLATGIATLLWWDISLKKNISLPIYAILIEGFLTGVSVLSRGTYIYHAIPQLFALYKKKKTLIGTSLIKGIFIAVIFIGLFIVSQSTVDTLRTYLYQNDHDFSNKMLLNEFVYQMRGGVFGRISQLAIDRWIGLEGVMAVQSYPKKGNVFFLNGIKEKSEIGKVALYEEVSKSNYRETPSTFQFGSLPGVAAFLYYSGSLWVVMLGMGVFSLLILLIERVVNILTANPLLCSLIGFGVANNVAQFGGAPGQGIPYFFMIFCSVLFIWFVQSRCLGKSRYVNLFF